MYSGYITDERRLIRDSAREFTGKEVTPLANRLDPEKGEIPAELVGMMADMGYFGILIPEHLGGLGLGVFEYCLVAEELSRGWMSVASLVARGNSFYRYIQGSARERSRKIRRMARGDYLGALALSEPDAGSDMASVSCRANRDGNHWVVTGSKYWCTFADGSDFINVVCKDVDNPENPQALVNIEIEKPRGQLPPGVTGSPIPKIGYHGWKTWELHFDNVRVPIADSAGNGADDAYKGFVGVQQMLEIGRVHTAARSIGCAQAALDVATDYSGERVQFGRPIAKFQAIRFKIATMATETEAARQLMYSVCSAIDAGVRSDKEAAMVKYYAAEMSERVTSDAMQILGGAGYTTHYPVERYWRDARLTRIFEGTSEIMQKIISDRLLGKGSE